MLPGSAEAGKQRIIPTSSSALCFLQNSAHLQTELTCCSSIRRVSASDSGKRSRRFNVRRLSLIFHFLILYLLSTRQRYSSRWQRQQPWSSLHFLRLFLLRIQSNHPKMILSPLIITDFVLGV